MTATKIPASLIVGGAGGGGMLFDITSDEFGANVSNPDNAAAIQAAINTATTAGGAIYIPEGVFTTGNLNLTCGAYGVGTLSHLTGATGNWISIVNSNNIVVEGITFRGLWHNVTSCIDVSGGENIRISRCNFYQTGGYTCHYNGVSKFYFTDNVIKEATNGVSNVMPSGSASATISSDVFIQDNQLSSGAGTAIYFAGKITSDPQYFLSNPLTMRAACSGNKLVDWAGHGIIGRAWHLTISNNIVSNCGNAAGLQSIVPQGKYITVSGNVCERGSGVGIDAGGCDNIAITGNTVLSKGQIGIEVNDSVNFSVTGNSIVDCGALESSVQSSGISIAEGFFGTPRKCEKGTVTGNTISSTGSAGRYGISVNSGVQDVVISGNNCVGAFTVSEFYLSTSANVSFYGNISQTAGYETFGIYNRAPKIAVQSSTGNCDFEMWPAGTGTFKFGKYMSTASTPANFSAQSYLPIKDAADNTCYIPISFSAW